MMPTNDSKTRPGYLHDHTGNRCSRRLWGSVLLSIGVSMGVVLFLYSLSNPENLFVSAYNVMQVFFISGGSLLGLSILESLKECFNKRG